jgi:hypothetical protein
MAVKADQVTIQEASRAYNEQRRGGLDATPQIAEIPYMRNPEKVHCVICGVAGLDGDHSGAGWWLVLGRPICAACVADSEADPGTLKRRVRKALRKWA